MAKFSKVAQKKMMVRFLELDGKTNIWTTCSEAVKKFASTAFKEGDTVNVQFENTGELGYHVTRIEKGNGADTNAGGGGGASNTGKPKCEDCGKELKDDKYKKCYPCNQKNPSSNKDRGSEVNTSIKKQAIGHMTSRSLIALQGHVDQNNIMGVIETLYKKYQELVG